MLSVALSPGVALLKLSCNVGSCFGLVEKVPHNSCSTLFCALKVECVWQHHFLLAPGPAIDKLALEPTRCFDTVSTKMKRCNLRETTSNLSLGYNFEIISLFSYP